LKYSNGHKRTLIDDAGKSALTKFRILNAWDNFSLLEVKILTGRTHQIRAHMKAIGNPLMCDDLYGDGIPFLLSKYKRKYNRDQERNERPLLARTGLHAWKLNFNHPKSGEQMKFEEEMPKDMRAVVYQLDKLNN
ncbi:MAG: RluA family pseudouridine synthase, partial [Saprospiraceae bacterium]|nr:RluA family pseudouridine synthase [Saprospiraceae bacterium]